MSPDLLQAREAVAILEWLVEEIPLLPEPQRAEALRRAPLPCLLHTRSASHVMSLQAHCQP